MKVISPSCCMLVSQTVEGEQQSSVAQLQADNLALQQALEDARRQLPPLQAEYERKVSDLRVRRTSRLRKRSVKITLSTHCHFVKKSICATAMFAVAS